MTRVIVFQHIDIEDLGFLKRLLYDIKIEIYFVKFHKGEKVPTDLKKFNLMISLGGPMDTFMTNDFPWIWEEKKAIEEFVIKMERPFLGLCLGCQLLGEVLGARVVKSQISEIGFFDINLSKNAKDDDIFKSFPKKFKAFHWHNFEVQKFDNKDVKVLASSITTPIQLFRYKNHAYGMQFHLEIEENSISNWVTNKDYLKSLFVNFGGNPIKELRVQQRIYINGINNLCYNFFNSFKKKYH